MSLGQSSTIQLAARPYLLLSIFRSRYRQILKCHDMNQSNPRDTVVNAGFWLFRKPDHQIAVPDQDKVRMMNIEPLAFAYHDAKWAKRSFAQPGLNTFCREHGRILVPAT